MRISLSVEVAGSPEEAFPWLDDPQKAMLWQQGVKHARIIHATPERIGTTFVEEMEEEGGSLQMRGVITGYARNELIAFRLESRVHEFDVSYSVARQGRSSLVTVEADVRWKFPLNVMSVVLGRRMKQGIVEQMQAELAVLQQLLAEEQARNAGQVK
jgi:hypothetical protein